MAFDPIALERTFRGRLRSQWQYTTADTNIDADPRYWDAAAGRLKVGDYIQLATGFGDASPSCDGSCVVIGKGVANGVPWVRMQYLLMVQQ